jgi:hypothetical protein
MMGPTTGPTTKETAMATLTTNFTSDRDVHAWVERYGIDALRDLVYSESMRSSSQYWGATWLARHARPNAEPTVHGNRALGARSAA